MGISASAYTSVNKDKVPALFKLACEAGIMTAGCSVLDYGCGRWPEVAKGYLATKGIDHVVSYDPNWFPIPAGYDSLGQATEGGYDFVCLSNVLNVIQADGDRRYALRRAWEALKPGGRLLATVYEADGTGASGPSKDGCWQERRKLESYLDQELAPYMGAVRSGKLWVSFPKPAKGEKFFPPAGTIATISRAYGGSAFPVTVVGRDGAYLVVRRCRLEFDGPRYYDTVADRILPGRPGIEEEIRMSWKPRGQGWFEKGPYGGYLSIGRWSHEPYVD